jgi:hypothetical protein
VQKKLYNELKAIPTNIPTELPTEIPDFTEMALTQVTDVVKNWANDIDNQIYIYSKCKDLYGLKHLLIN